MTAAAVIGELRAAADSLAIDTGIWAARNPGEPLEYQPEATAARASALKTIDATIEQLRQLRPRAHGGRPPGPRPARLAEADAPARRRTRLTIHP